MVKKKILADLFQKTQEFTILRNNSINCNFYSNILVYCICLFLPFY